MPLSFGHALINRGAHLSISKATLSAHFSQLHALSYLPGNFGRPLINRGVNFSISKATLGALFFQGRALSNL